MNLLVTGSAGFIGSAFVRMLLGNSSKHRAGEPRLGAKGKIVSLDLLTYAGSMENLAPVMSDPRHVFVKGDICDRKLIERLVKEHHIEGILNFAAESHVDRSIDGSEVFARTNVLGTLALLEVARTHKLRYLQVSTDEVYGALGAEGAFTEETPLAPNSPYSAAKVGGDAFVRAYVHTHGLDAITTRCSNNFGPYHFPEKFIPLSITRLMTGGKVPLYGSGNQVRDWLFVEDHCEGIWLAFTKGRKGEVYNLGGHGERPNVEVARVLAGLLGRPAEGAIEYITDRPGHDWRYAINPAKAERELGWKPRWTFEEGLAYTVDWYKTHPEWWQPKVKS